MRRAAPILLVLAAALWPLCSQAAQPTAAVASAPPAPSWHPDDRLVFSGQHETLTGANGGEGGSLAYIHEFTPNWLIQVGGEYQKLANSHWDFGSLSTAYSHALSQHTRWNVQAEGHRGTGMSGSHRFDYSIFAGGVGLTFANGLSASVEERHISVDTSHGSLPKVTLSKPWGRHVLTSVGYARSVSGNLDTQYGLARVDVSGPGFALIGGGSFGRASPVVLNINGVLQSRARSLSEEFFGVTVPIARTSWTLLADELNLAGAKRFTLTLNLTVHL